MSRFELFVGSADFWAAAQADIAGARARVLVQAMTFEADAAGMAVARAIGESGAADRRVLVDDYTRHVINDQFLALARDPAVIAEARATRTMFDGLQAAGAVVRVTNPIRFNPFEYPVRNHKKLLVMDGVAWIGGINFSDHNFAWHDMMLRIDDAEVADWLAGEFDKDWTGNCAPSRAGIGGVELISIDGAANGPWLQPVLDLLAGASRSIEMISAYPTFPFVTAMAEAAARGVAVTLHTPRESNKPVIRDYLLGVSDRTGLEIRLMPGMSHVKALLVDGEALVVGSCNFDFVSYRANAEYIATIRDAGLVGEFEARLFGPARKSSVPASAKDVSRLRAWLCWFGLAAADKAVSLLPRGECIAGWSKGRLKRLG